MEEKKEECKTGCGCCCGKAIKALVLLLLGGVIGFLMGRSGWHRGYCPLSSHGDSTYDMPAPAAAPAPQAVKAKHK